MYPTEADLMARREINKDLLREVEHDRLCKAAGARNEKRGLTALLALPLLIPAMGARILAYVLLNSRHTV